MGYIGKGSGAVPTTLFQVKGDGECCCSGRNMDRSATGEVEVSKSGTPTISIPCPICNGIIDESRPNENKEKEWTQMPTLCKSSKCQHGTG